MSFAIAMLLGVTAGEARAQMTMASFKGYLTGHLGGVTAGDVTDGATSFGGSVSVQEGSGWGAELDIAHAGDVIAGAQFLDINSYLVNAAWVRPAGRFRPFGVGGVGVLQIDGCGSPCTSASTTYDFGLNVGGGVYALLNDWAAVRGDARYIWTSAEHADHGRPDGLKFWRLTAGFTFMWAVLP
jgi:hypothetical protein